MKIGITYHIWFIQVEGLCFLETESLGEAQADLEAICLLPQLSVLW